MKFETRHGVVGLALVAAILAAGCTTPTKPQEQEPPPTKKDPEPGPPPTLQQMDQLGAYSAGAPRAILTSPTSPFMLVGLVGSTINPAWVGSDEPPNEEGLFIPSGLAITDVRSGKTRVLTRADGVPTMSYSDGPIEYGTSTAPFFDLAWIEQDKSFAAASWAYVVKGTLDAEGHVTFTKTTLRAPGANADAFVGQVEVAGDDLFVGTDQGLAVLNAADLTLKSWVNFGSRSPQVMSLSTAMMSGHVVVAAIGDAARPLTTVAMIRPGEAPVFFDFTGGEMVTAVFGMQDAAVIGVVQKNGRGALHVVRMPGDSFELVNGLSADELSTSSFGSVVPHSFAYDNGRGVLLVGGRIMKGGGGSGFLQVPASADAYFLGTAQDIVDRRDPYRDILPMQPEVIHVDSLGRWFVAGRSLCSEHKYRAVGLYRIDRPNAELRLLRPWLSGVRSVTVDPDGRTWVGLRDTLPSLGCEGAISEQSVCRLRADGSCEIFTPYINANLDIFAPSPGASRIAFGDPSRREFALATIRDALFVQKGETTRGLATQYNPGISLEMTSAAWDSTGALWVGSATEWHEEDDPKLDNDKINARSPHGLGWIALGDDATPTAMRRYVRVASDNLPNVDVAGMPSNQVWDVLPLPGEKTALVALGIERNSKTYDHIESEPNKRNIRGGLVVIDDTTIHNIVAPQGVTFGDVVGLAKQQDGGYFALDAEAGIFSVDVVNKAATLWAAPAWTAPARATALAVDKDGRIAVSTTHGVYVYSAARGALKVAGRELGVTWTVRFMSNGFLYAGADQGLLRVALDDGNFETSPGPDESMSRNLWETSWGCYGELDCACRPEKPCAFGLECACPNGLDSCKCIQPDPCEVNPGSIDCTCSDTIACDDGLICGCTLDDVCTCQPEPSCEQDCSCTGDGTVDGCPGGTTCENGTCQSPLPPACAADCSCSGPEALPDGCPIDYRCENGIRGPTCLYLGPAACEEDCTCTGPGTTEGCPNGYECITGPFGSVCDQLPADPCEVDCSCAGPNTTDGCPDNKSCVVPRGSTTGTCE